MICFGADLGRRSTNNKKGEGKEEMENDANEAISAGGFSHNKTARSVVGQSDRFLVNVPRFGKKADCPERAATLRERRLTKGKKKRCSREQKKARNRRIVTR